MRVKKYRKVEDRIKLSAGDAVKTAREMLEMSQAELAKAAGIRQSHLSEIEHGKRSMGCVVAEKLARALDLPPSLILFAGETPREGADKVDVLVMNIMQHIKDVSKSGKPLSLTDEKDIISDLKKIQKALAS
ncbi:MAG: helix-turn-helix transcriptional regulator [Pseudomonadota bacterium]